MYKFAYYVIIDLTGHFSTSIAKINIDLVFKLCMSNYISLLLCQVEQIGKRLKLHFQLWFSIKTKCQIYRAGAYFCFWWI